jgi:low temperature requirement protein LtrA
MVLNIGLSSKWKVLGFKRTHLVERMSLLTLYILGEGVIDVLKSVGKVRIRRLFYHILNLANIVLDR